VNDYDGPPLYLFIGISTAGSSVFDLFPRWAPIIAQGGVLRGVDLPETAPPDAFRNLVIAMRDNPRVIGAVVTSHKLRLHRAIHDLLDSADVLTDITHEISALDTRGGVRAYARDPQSLDVVLDSVGGTGATAPRSVYCIGSGGAAIAMLLAMGLDIPASLDRQQVVIRSPSNPRGPLTIVGCDPESLRIVEEARERAGLDGAPISLVLAETPEDTAEAIRRAPEGSIIANGTGLGKLSPGSPLAGPDAFPKQVLAWDFNYRGPLTFLRQAAEAGLRTEDGWDYFVAGWAAALVAINGENLTSEHLSAMRLASDGLRPRRPH
jgi:shikimate 5-dehydrogenase